MLRCSICKFPVQDTDATTQCPECDEVYHSECWDSLGGCATYGCTSAATPDEKITPENISGGWGDEKKCPNCNSMIASGLLICTSCSVTFPYAEPMTRSEYREWIEREAGRRSKRTHLTIAFFISLLIITAPFSGAFAGYTAYTNREDLLGDYGAYVALGYGTAVLGALSAVVLFLLAIGL